MTRLAAAVTAYIEAETALHVVHPSTDVHGRGGVAGQAITPHCAWQCNVGRLGENGYFESVHRAELERQSSALAELGIALIRENEAEAADLALVALVRERRAEPTQTSDGDLLDRLADALERRNR